MRSNLVGRERGLSLIELLVVIAIIAILASLLLPAIGRAKASANRAECASNLKQWGIIWHSYTSDRNGFFPDGQSSNSGMPRGEWVWVLAKHYSEKPGLLTCPEAVMRRASGPSAATVEHRVRLDAPDERAVVFGGPRTVFDFPVPPKIDNTPGALWFSSYGQNSWAYNIRGSNLQGRKAAYHWRTMDVGYDASEVPLFSDAMWRGGGLDHNIPQKFRPPASHGLWEGYEKEANHFAIMRHGSGINMLYFDGSVRGTQSAIDIWKMKWHQDFDIDRWENTSFPAWMR